ncbi:M15 family metallopeptidase [Crocinitomicaceae bacterium]|nr:M15 family metallopeptidase [Crocinitomicaceae bacterium]MDC1402955.1 M15 family metallopeptidase [Crocinitomicaceae bacterium]
MKSHKIIALAFLGFCTMHSCKSTDSKEGNGEIESTSQSDISEGKLKDSTTENASIAFKSDSLMTKNKDADQDFQTDPKRSSAWNTLVDIRSVNSNIYVDLKYASSDNFMKMVLYDTIRRAYLQKDVAERLGKCQEYLSTLNKDYHLLVYDGVRPVSVQWKMWLALDSIPVNQRVNFVSNPVNGSIHNYGAAVDLTICDGKGKPLDMGAGYDDIRKIAYPKYESQFLKYGELTEAQVANRKMLRKVMTSQNFRNIQTEWWHFNACSRNEAKAKYVQLK